jgi:hypothetical protein
MLVTAALTLAWPTIALAHDPGLSALEVLVTSSRIVAILSIAAADLAFIAEVAAERNGREPQVRAVDRTERRLGAFASTAVTIRLDGRMLEGSVHHVAIDESGGHVQLSFPAAPGATLGISSDVSRLLARGHRELVSIRSGDGSLLSEYLLDALSGEQVTNLPVSANQTRGIVPAAAGGGRGDVLLTAGAVAGLFLVLTRLWIRTRRRRLPPAAASADATGWPRG